jgi:hypothetical protein
MRKLLIILTFFIAIESFGQPNDADRILTQKRGIEDQIKLNKKNLIVFVKIKGQPIPLRITNEKWPENIESTYNILKNDLGQVIYFAEFPKSESGDWVFELKHFFNNKEQTISIEKRLSFFNEDCSDGAITEILTDLYLDNFKLHGTVKQLRDSKDNPIRDANCGDPYKWPIDKKGTAQELITLKKIKIQ